MLEFDAARCRTNVRKAETGDLLDRITVFREDLEPGAVPIIERELRDRGIDALAISQYEQKRPRIKASAGYVLKCSLCHRPAINQAWGWHKMWGFLPVFPRLMRWCEEHQPRSDAN
ncbi:hypothetical protein KIH39_04220 [Telmatocola sphagniphila]|uniref:Uncharacterized protein n=1 Tax=Telmatocola sphagniphila TaxID=1123043 RepID=A0A8E6B8C0_9BACT|nr:hypothetical protein [Telmatocola sphagniphila]QVL33129.1 hypothetical protein KIH39_04220 [Telmatocola sphagniphila]